MASGLNFSSLRFTNDKASLPRRLTPMSHRLRLACVWCCWSTTNTKPLLNFDVVSYFALHRLSAIFFRSWHCSGGFAPLAGMQFGIKTHHNRISVFTGIQNFPCRGPALSRENFPSEAVFGFMREAHFLEQWQLPPTHSEVLTGSNGTEKEERSELASENSFAVKWPVRA